MTDPTPGSMRRLALAGVIVTAAVISTGAGVRVSSSGLGCTNWPACTSSSLVASRIPGSPMFHTWIEFGNRLLSVAMLLVGLAVLVAAWRFRPDGASRRRDLVWLAAIQPVGVLAEAVVGGVVVLTHLNPYWVSVHFFVTPAVVAGTVALWVRCTEGTGRAVPLARRELRLLAYGMIAVVTAQFAVGTVVTGTGPLAGAVGVPRYHLSLEGITQLHADVGWLLGGVVFALVLGLRLTGAPARATRTAYLLLGLIALQGLIGYVQYFSHLPAGLVWLHVTNSALIWIVAVLLPFRLRDRGSVTAPGRTPPSAPDGTAVQPAPDEVSTPTV